MSSMRLMVLVLRWLILAVAVWVAAELVGGIHLEGWESTLIVAAVLGLLNLYVKPVLVLLSFPVTLLTLGLFLVVINALLLGLTHWLVNQFGGIEFSIDSVGAALLGAVIISIVSTLIGLFINPERLARSLHGF
jgi:putative membrane protein